MSELPDDLGVGKMVPNIAAVDLLEVPRTPDRGDMRYGVSCDIFDQPALG